MQLYLDLQGLVLVEEHVRGFSVPPPALLSIYIKLLLHIINQELASGIQTSIILDQGVNSFLNEYKDAFFDGPSILRELVFELLAKAVPQPFGDIGIALSLY